MAALAHSSTLDSTSSTEMVHAPAMPTDFSNFLLFPPEIRDNIYEQLLSSTNVNYGRQQSAQDPYAFGLAFASRMISDEFIEHIYRNKAFIFNLSRHHTPNYRDWKVSQNTLRRIRYCRFQTCSDQNDGEDWELWLPDLVKPLESLRVLEAGFVKPDTVKDIGGRERTVSIVDKNDDEMMVIPKKDWADPDGGSWLL